MHPPGSRDPTTCHRRAGRSLAGCDARHSTAPALSAHSVSDTGVRVQPERHSYRVVRRSRCAERDPVDTRVLPRHPPGRWDGPPHGRGPHAHRAARRRSGLGRAVPLPLHRAGRRARGRRRPGAAGHGGGAGRRPVLRAQRVRDRPHLPRQARSGPAGRGDRPLRLGPRLPDLAGVRRGVPPVRAVADRPARVGGRHADRVPGRAAGGEPAGVPAAARAGPAVGRALLRRGLLGRAHVVGQRGGAGLPAVPLAALVFHRLRDLPVALLAAGSLALMTPIAWAYLLTGSPYHPWSWAVPALCGVGAGVRAQLVVRRLNGSAAGAAGRPSERVRKWASAIVAALPLVVAAGLVAGELIGPGRGGAVLGAFPVLVGALALADRGPAMWLARPSTVRGGRLSYSLYLVHIPMFELFWTAQEHFPGELGRSTTTGHAVGLSVLLATVPVAALVHRLVEEPARLRLGRLGRVGRRPAPQSVPIVFIPAPVGPSRATWRSAAPQPRRGGSSRRRGGPGE